MRDLYSILPSQMTASEAFALFLKRLRDTGTDLPASDSNICAMVLDALQEYIPPVSWDEDGAEAEFASAALDLSHTNMTADLEVIVEALRDREKV